MPGVESHYTIHISDEMPAPGTRRAFLVHNFTDEEIASVNFVDGDPTLSWGFDLLDAAKEAYGLDEESLLINFCVIDGWVPSEKITQQALERTFSALMANGPMLVDRDEDGKVVRRSWRQKDPIELVPFGVYTYYQLNVILGLVESLNWDALRDF